jgi:tetratricopeptide (TPR) repeat protein
LKTERDLNPTSRDQIKRAKAAMQAKNDDYAINLLQTVLKDEPLFLEGRRMLRAIEIQKYESTSNFARQMTSMKMTGGMMKFPSGKKTPQEQLIQAEEILVQDPYNLKANAMLGDAGTALGYPEFKCFAYETLAKGKPGDKAILHKLAEAYMGAKDAGKAEKTYERIVEIDPLDAEALSGSRNASAAHTAKSGGWDSSGGDYRNVLKSKTGAEQLEQESKVVKSAEAIEEQIRFYYQKHEAEPANPVHSKAIAELFLQKNDYESGVQWYEHAFEAGGRIDSSLEKVIGDLRLKKGEREMEKLRETLARQIEPEGRAHIQTEIAQKEKELNETRLFLAEARVKAQPNEGEFRYHLGEALYLVGQYKRATEELQQSLKQPSVRSQALNLLGLAFLKRGMFDFAITRLALGESELPGMPDIKKEIVYNLGLAYEANGQSDKALEQWKKIYEVDMTYRDVGARVEASYGSDEQAA